MWSAAIASSSPVVTPGRTAARRSSSVSPTTRPARRICAICSGDLISMALRSRNIVGSAVRLQHVDGTLGDLVDLALGLDRAQQPAAAVVADERRSLVVVDLQPVANGLRLVVVALEQLAPAQVADVFLLGRVELGVPHVAARAAGSATGQTAHHLVLVDAKLERSFDRLAELDEHLVEGLGLRQRARKPVEQE